KSYGITRERVRQIEEFTLGQLAKSMKEANLIEPFVSQAKTILTDNGHIVKERDLFQAFSGTSQDTVINASLVFVLTLNDELVRFSENDSFHAFWASSAQHLSSFKEMTSGLVKALDKNKKVINESELHALAVKQGVPGMNGNLES